MRWIKLSCGVVLGLGLALALDASHASAEPRPVAPRAAPHRYESAPKADPSAPPALIFAMYDAHTKSMRRARLGRAVALGVLGSGAVITSLSGLPEDPFASSYLAIVGTGALVGSLMSFAILSGAEYTTREMRAGACCAEPSALHARWAMEAKHARATRTGFGVISAIYGVANATLGVVVLAADDPNLDESLRSNLAAFGLVAGTVGLAGAAAFLMIPSPTERALAQFEAVPTALRTARLSLRPLPGGAAIVLGGAY